MLDHSQITIRTIPTRLSFITSARAALEKITLPLSNALTPISTCQISFFQNLTEIKQHADGKKELNSLHLDSYNIRFHTLENGWTTLCSIINSFHLNGCTGFYPQSQKLKPSFTA